jgi:hypothetical protein
MTLHTEDPDAEGEEPPPELPSDDEQSDAGPSAPRGSGDPGAPPAPPRIQRVRRPFSFGPGSERASAPTGERASGARQQFFASVRRTQGAAGKARLFMRDDGCVLSEDGAALIGRVIAWGHVWVSPARRQSRFKCDLKRFALGVFN